MPAVTGPPPEMAESRGDLTPMMRQYFELTEQYDDCLVLFQVGDFYEAFCDAAEEVSKVLEVTLTQREDSTGTYRMAGIPIDNAASYVEGLLDAGYRVAVADQVEDPDEASGVVDRAVTRVVTPGTVTDDELLAGSATYLACLARETDAERVNGASADPADATHAVAFLDVSTGEFRVTSVESRRRAIEELDRVGPAEVVFAPEFADSEGDEREDADSEDTVDTDSAITDASDSATTGASDESDADDATGSDHRLAEAFGLRAATTVYDPNAFDTESARNRVGRYVEEPDAVLATDAELRACGGLLAYAEYTQGDGVRGDVPEEPAAVGVSGGGEDAEESADATSADPTDADPTLGYVTRIRRYDPDDALRLDPTAIRSLELFENRTREDGPTLLGVVDDTASALGRRRLESWLRRPLLDTERIDARQSAVAEFSERSLVRAEVRDLLESVYDVERLLGRVARSRANARDLRSLKTTLDAVPELKESLEAVESDRLVALRERLDELADVRGLIDDAISEDPPAEITEGGIVASGYDDELDDLRETEQSGREWVADLEAQERERTGIDSLSVGYNQVHGYYIEVTKPNLDRVPDDYTRRQTLKNSERFYTPELKRREDEIIGAAERADSLEYDLFRDVRRDVAEEAERVQDVADALAELDTLATLAEVAVARDWTRPEVVDYDTGETGDSGAATVGAPAIDIEGGRHPVVADAQSSFVPNDTHLGDSRIAVVTGPNMSGKSTYMRQVALVCLLAQVGSFVPADAARVPALDRIFTRVGASDDIAGGQSTFMREMSELTDILHDATERSLVLLDEVGRGTSTTDGLSIAWATTEFVHDEVGAFTLFATHYHELTAIADELPGVTNYHFSADREDSGVTFRHEVRDGPASSSYGVEVAGLAGVPDPVVGRSRELVERGGPGGETRDEDADESASSARDDSDAVATDAVQATLEGDPVTDASDSESSASADDSTLSVADETVADLFAELRDIDVADTTPLDALNRLHDLRELAESADLSADSSVEPDETTSTDQHSAETDR